MSMNLKDDILNAVKESNCIRTGCKTPKFRKPTAPPQYEAPPMPPVKPPNPPTSGSNAQKPPNIGSGVQAPNKSCPYKTPCGWCTKWDKKCDLKTPKSEPPCAECDYNGWNMPQCRECNEKNDYKYFERIIK